MNSDRQPLPQLFKGIALFTPGGDLIYCIDPSKKSRWHLHLCAALQEMLGLSEPPHFLVPCYTATIDRWLDPQTQQMRISAEAYPPVLRHQTLLNAVFETQDLVWRVRIEELCNPMVIATYYNQFPELWENHELIVQFPSGESQSESEIGSLLALRRRSGGVARSLYADAEATPPLETQGYVLRLFVSGNNAATERTLKTLHQLLDQTLGQPYTLKVIDVFKHPDQAEADQISATPTLIKVWPRPVRRIVGELGDVDKILRLLAVSEV
ncbi:MULTISPECIES: circadian clock KaiB family protein [Kamptonema]|uniref:circadian clock KaiB family protein n=1 Tax=Kamptonema TaxID=1501433 RepID=UPI0002EF3769|nr:MULTISPECIES: circadian clock KaiB family protein [Kamptonema]